MVKPLVEKCPDPSADTVATDGIGLPAGQPCLLTERLLLRPFTLADAADVQRLAGQWEISAYITTIPYPYPDGLAEQWIGTHREDFEQGKAAIWAITLRDVGTLIGSIGLTIHREDRKAELGYWIGRPYWGQGYCTEAARAVVHYGFTALGLNRIYAMHMRPNVASGRVMQKLGMRYEGRLRQHVLKWGVFEDMEVYALLKDEYEASGGVGLSHDPVYNGRQAERTLSAGER